MKNALENLQKWGGLKIIDYKLHNDKNLIEKIVNAKNFSIEPLTAFVYEALIRELTKSIIKQNKNRSAKVKGILKEHFSKGKNQEITVLILLNGTMDQEVITRLM